MGPHTQRTTPQELALWVGSTMLTKRMPRPEPNTTTQLPFYELGVIASQQDSRHARLTFNLNPDIAKILETCMRNFHSQQVYSHK
jgi:hypothetical protein